MSELHPTTVELAKIETEYSKALAKLAVLKVARRNKKREHKTAIIKAIMDSPDTPHVDLAALFGVTEGTIRHARRELTAEES